MMFAGARALWSHWRRHPFQGLVLIIGLALATGLWTGVQAINAEARASYDRAANLLGQDQRAQITRPGAALTLVDFVTLRRAGWLVTPVIRAGLPGGSLQVVGIDPFTAPPGPGTPDLSALGDLSEFLSGQGVVFAHPDTLPQLPPHLATGRPLNTLAPGLVLTDIENALRLTQKETLTAILVLETQPNGLPDLATIDPGLRLSAPSGGSDIARLTDSFHLNLTAFGLLSFAVGLFIVHAAIGLAFEQRRPLFRTLRALGMTKGGLTGLLIGECVLLATIGGALGILLGYIVAAALLPGVAATLSGLYGAGVGGSLSLSPWWWLTGFAMAYGGAGVAAAGSLWQLAKLPVLAPAMPRAWARANGKTALVQALAGGVLLGGSFLLALFGSGLLAGFACLAALLVGAALLVPSLFAGLLAGAAHFKTGPVMEWVWADTRQQIPGLSLALMALLLALSANVGVSTMVGSFRTTFTGWLDQRLASELYVTARSASEAQAIATFVTPRVEALLPIVSVDETLGGAPGEVFGIVDHATYRDHWPLLAQRADAWDAVANGKGILVNEQLARREDLWIGASLKIGTAEAMPVVGVYSDYGNPSGQAILGMTTFAALYPDHEIRQFALRVQDPTALQRDVLEAFDLPAQNVVNQAQIKAFSLDVFEQTFLVTRALNILTLGVAGFALWASLTTLSAMRLPQLAPIWALGLTRRTIAWLELFRALGLAVLVALFALPTGILLAWVLLAVVNVEAFGWRLPMQVFPAEWAWLILWAVLGAGLASALPVLRLARMDPAELVKVFANAR